MKSATIPFTPGEPNSDQAIPSKGGRRVKTSAAQIAAHHAEQEFTRGHAMPSSVIRQLNRGRKVRLEGSQLALECSENTLEIAAQGNSYVLSLRSGAQSFTLVSHGESATLITHEAATRYEGKVAGHLHIYASRLYAVAVRTREEHNAMMRRSHQQIAALGVKVKRMTETRVRKQRASSRGPATSAHDAASVETAAHMPSGGHGTGPHEDGRAQHTDNAAATTRRVNAQTAH